MKNPPQRKKAKDAWLTPKEIERDMKPTQHRREDKRGHRCKWVFQGHHYVSEGKLPYGYQCSVCGATKRTAKSLHRHRYLPMNYDRPTCRCGKPKPVGRGK